MFSKGQLLRTLVAVEKDLDSKAIPKGSVGTVLAVNPEGNPLMKFKGRAWPRAYKAADVQPA